MSKVSVTKDKLDILANAIANKSGEPLTLTLDEMVSAVDGIDTSGGGITPSGNIDITHAGQTDVTNYATATVPSVSFFSPVSIPIETHEITVAEDTGEVNSFVEVGGNISPITQNGFAETTDTISTYNSTNETYFLPTQSSATITPTESSQTAVAKGKWTTGAVTVSAIPSNYVGSGITQRSSTDLTVSGATVTAPSGYYSASASKSVASGSATAAATISGTSATVSTGTNTLTLSKTVSNTPQVTAGYVSSGTAGNSSVSLTANVTTKGTATITPTTSNQTIASGTYITGTQTISGDANLVAGNIKSGTTIFGVTGTYAGGGSLTVATKTLTNNATTQTLSFSSLSGQPKYWFLRATTNVSSSGSTTYYYVTDCFYDGTNIKGNTFRIGSTRRVQNITSGITQSYSGGTLTITAGSSSGATPGQFYGTTNFGYELVYVY